jgi:hypothetical protein
MKKHERQKKMVLKKSTFHSLSTDVPPRVEERLIYDNTTRRGRDPETGISTTDQCQSINKWGGRFWAKTTYKKKDPYTIYKYIYIYIYISFNARLFPCTARCRTFPSAVMNSNGILVLLLVSLGCETQKSEQL